MSISGQILENEKDHRNHRLLIVDDHASIRELLANWARNKGYQATIAPDGVNALALLEQNTYDLVISDVRMPGLNGIELLQRMPINNQGAKVVFMTAFGSVQEAVQSMHLGAIDYVTKPFKVEELFARIETRLRQRQSAQLSPSSFPRSLRTPARVAGITSDRLLIGAPENLQQVYDLVDQVAPSTCTIFIKGPSGVGKEVVATEIHQRGTRAKQPFIRVNCPAIPKELQESELFGHEKGSFTGANRRRDGKFFFANGGTILLDEISETSLAFQSKLLRVLQEREYERVGGNEIIKLDVRLIATSNRSLAEMVAKGKFREDLFYRLNVVPIEIRPLNERAEDIPYLVKYFIQRFCEENQRPNLPVAGEAMDVLKKRRWSGNVRQLQNICERAVVLKRQNEELQIRDFFLDLEIDNQPAAGVESGTVNGMEQALILKTLRQTRANRTEAARRLGISVRTLRNKLNEYRALNVDVDGMLESAAR